MFRKLRIQNFKLWHDTGEIHLAPLTLFFGTNSSGKSSIGQFLMLLKQTVESSDRRAVLNTDSKQSMHQLGSFREMVHRRDPMLRIEFSYLWDLDKKLRIHDPIMKQFFEATEMRFSGEIGMDEQGAAQVKSMHYDVQDFGVGMRDRGKNKFDIDVETYQLKRNPGKPKLFEPPIRFYGFPDELNVSFQNTGFLQDLNLRHEQLFQRLSYLGPLRTHADRLYTWSGTAPETVGFTGEHTIAAILAARNRKIALANKQRYKPFEEIIAGSLEKLGLIKDFEVRPISKHRQDYEVKVRTFGSSDWVDLPDVGFGISQVLPVLAQCFYAPPGSVIIMEQPEIHLHPNAQSALADVMIDVINTREDGENRSVQLLIETHSEHFLRRLQRRIAENDVSQSSVAAYFANVSKSPACLEPLEIDDYGNIRNWPDNFFGDEMGDITAQSKAALQKRMAQKVY